MGPGTDFISKLPSYPAVQPRKRSSGLRASSLRSPDNSSLSLPLDSEAISQHHHHPNPVSREFPQLPSISPALTSPSSPAVMCALHPPPPCLLALEPLGSKGQVLLTTSYCPAAIATRIGVRDLRQKTCTRPNLLLIPAQASAASFIRPFRMHTPAQDKGAHWCLEPEVWRGEER